MKNGAIAISNQIECPSRAFELPIGSNEVFRFLGACFLSFRRLQPFAIQPMAEIKSADALEQIFIMQVQFQRISISSNSSCAFSNRDILGPAVRGSMDRPGRIRSGSETLRLQVGPQFENSRRRVLFSAE